MINESTITRFNASLEKWRKLDLTKFYRDELGANSLRSLEGVINEFSRDLERTAWSINRLTENVVNMLINHIDQIIREIEAISWYDGTVFVSQLNYSKQKIQTPLNGFRNTWIQVLALINDRPDLDKVSEDAEKINQIKEEVYNLKKDLEEQNEELQIKLNNTNNSLEIISKGGDINTHAEKDRKTSIVWIIIAGVLSLVLGIYATYTIYLDAQTTPRPSCLEVKEWEKTMNKCSEYDKYIFWIDSGKLILYRGLLITLIICLINISLKNYYANMHNYTLNQRRLWFISFVLTALNFSANNEDGKNKILLTALDKIFQDEETGYSKPAEIKNTMNALEKVGDLFQKFKP